MGFLFFMGKGRLVRTILATSLLLITGTTMTIAEDTGAARIARWQDNKQAAFMLFFDDGCRSHLTNAIPELRKRGLTGTFYLFPAAEFFKKHQSEWEDMAVVGGMEFGNHTMTHSGAPDYASIEKELVECSAYIRRVNPPSPDSPLLSYAKPGGVDKNWHISEEEHQRAQDKALVVRRNRTPNNAAGINIKTAAEMFALAQTALETGDSASIVFHGVGGDWLSVDMPEFLGLLDLLKENEDRLWIAGHIAQHKYEAARDKSTVKTLSASDTEIRLQLSSDIDIGLYDYPLTLLCRIPGRWKACRVEIAGQEAQIVAGKAGEAMFRARPGAGEIVLRAAD